MDITESLLMAMTLLGLGMAFVFLFLGLLMIAVKLMAKYIPADQPIVSNKPAVKATASEPSEINPKLVAAISSAVLQYRKTKTA